MSSWNVRLPVIEAKIARLLVKMDDLVEKGQVVAEVDVPDLRTFELVAPHAGKVREVVGRVGDNVTHLSIIVVVAPFEDDLDPYVERALNPAAAQALYRAEMRYLDANGWLIYCGTHAPYARPEDPSRHYTHEEALLAQRAKDGLSG